MILEDLLSRLSDDYGEIKFIYFSEDQARLSSAHLELYGNLDEQRWDELIIENEPTDAVYILSIPHERWPIFLEVKKFLIGKGAKVYLLCSKNLVDRANEVVLNASAPGLFIEKVVPFRSLRQDYCIEISRSDSVSAGYLERAASESAVERNKRKRLREEVLLLKSELSKSHSERDTQAAERTKLAEERDGMAAELARLAAEVNKLIVERDEALLRWESVKREDEQQSQKRNDVLEKKNKELQALLTNKEAELVYHRDRSRLIKATASYQFGNLFVEATRSPKKFLLLPYTVLRFLSVGLAKKLRAQRTGKRHYPKKKHDIEEKKGLYKLVKRTAEADEEKLAAYLTGFEPSKDWVGIISSSWFASQFAPDFAKDEISRLHPNTWLFLFKKKKPSKVFIESSFMDTGGGSWASCLEGGAYGYPYHLIELLSFCRENSIPTILWHTSESEDGSLASDIFPFLDKIYVTRDKDEKNFKEFYGGDERRIEILRRKIGNGSQAESIRNMLFAT